MNQHHCEKCGRFVKAYIFFDQKRSFIKEITFLKYKLWINFLFLKKEPFYVCKYCGYDKFLEGGICGEDNN